MQDVLQENVHSHCEHDGKLDHTRRGVRENEGGRRWEGVRESEGRGGGEVERRNTYRGEKDAQIKSARVASQPTSSPKTMSTDGPLVVRLTQALCTNRRSNAPRMKSMDTILA